jgi:hypothetical protein
MISAKSFFANLQPRTGIPRERKNFFLPIITAQFVALRSRRCRSSGSRGRDLLLQEDTGFIFYHRRMNGRAEKSAEAIVRLCQLDVIKVNVTAPKTYVAI